MKIKSLAFILAVSGLLVLSACSSKVALTVDNQVGGDISVVVAQQEDSESVLSQTLFDGMLETGKTMVITVDKGYVSVTATRATTATASEQFNSGALFSAQKVTATVNPITDTTNVGTIIFSEP